MNVSEEVILSSFSVMERAFRLMEAALPPPKAVPIDQGFVWRFTEKHVEQALIQKLARYISGLHALHLLMSNGFFQEQAAIQRILDEIQEDITFLSLALTNDTISELHLRYLSAFWAEEFDADNPLDSTQKRDYPTRKKIAAYNVRVSEMPNLSSLSKLHRTLSKTYSGYVHAASPQVMEMFGGDPPRFHLRGMLDTPRVLEHSRDAWNYFYRGLLATTTVAKAFGARQLVERLYDFIAEFESASGTAYRDGRMHDMTNLSE